MNFRVLQAVPFCRAFSIRLHLETRESPPLVSLEWQGAVFFETLTSKGTYGYR